MSRICAWLGLVVAAALGAGCGASAQEAYFELEAAAANEDEEAFLGGLTLRSRALAEGLLDIGEQTRAQLRVLPTAFALLPPGELVADDVDGDVAVLTLSDGRERREVVMRRERGEWRLDLFEVDWFWFRVRRP